MIKDRFKLGKYELAMCYKLEHSIGNINRDIEDFFWIDIDDDSDISISQTQLYDIYKLVQNYKCGRKIQLTGGVFRCFSDCFAFEDNGGIEILIEFGDETARLKDWIYNTLKELGYRKFNEKIGEVVVKPSEIESNITRVIPLDNIKHLYVTDEGLQQILKEKEIFNQYEFKICWNNDCDSWNVTPIRKQIKGSVLNV